jgi:N-succinyldiaminopimelate aminotransferase
MNPDLQHLQAYPFERLAALKKNIQPPAHLPHIALSMGEPKHAAPALVLQTLTAHLTEFSHYPTTRGIPELRAAIAHWLKQRFQLPAASLDPDKHILPVNGTREALFALAQAVVDRRTDPLVMMPNPFYQIYEGAALLAGAQPYFLNTTTANHQLPDFDAVPTAIWNRCQLLYICSPGNPNGRVLSTEILKHVLGLAAQYNFVIAADECYSEIYFDEAQPPPGLLQAATAMGNDEYKHCVVLHSLSKRSNLPGLRSGFVAGDAQIIEGFYRYRTYHGCAMSLPNQWASIAAWSDEQHVISNRRLYRQKFAAVLAELAGVLDIQQPDAGFYLWPQIAGSDELFARDLFATQNLTVLPGSYLSRNAHGKNPGASHIRMALVAELDQCVTAAQRLRQFLQMSRT